MLTFTEFKQSRKWCDDWFENGAAPYPVYRVADGSYAWQGDVDARAIVEPEKKES